MTPVTNDRNRPDLPSYLRPEVAALSKSRERSRTLVAGTDAVHAARESFLPRWSDEDPERYTQRATLTEVYGGYARALEASTGLVFATPPTFELPAKLAVLEQDADGMGTNLVALSRRLFADALAGGLAGVLVDFPRVAEVGAVSIASAQRDGLRPYFVPISADQICNWRTETIRNRVVLTQLTIAEVSAVDDGAFGIDEETQYRVYRRTDTGVTVGVWAVRDQKAVLLVDAAVVVGPTEIPFAPIYGSIPQAMLVAKPPLDHLATLNVGHYRVSADHRWLSHLCHAPTFTLEGWIDPPIVPGTPAQKSAFKLGPNSVVKTPPGCTAKWLQADPNALESSEKTMTRLQDQMAVLGMAFLARDKQRSETATGRRLDAAAEYATLATAAQALEEGLTLALTFAAQFASTTEPASVTVTTTYDESRLDAQTITALSGLAKDGQITVETLLRELQRGRVLTASVDPEQESLDAATSAAAREPALSRSPAAAA